MDPTLVTFAIRAAVRLGNAGSEAFAQHARDREILLPKVKSVKIPIMDNIATTFHMSTEPVPDDVKPFLDSFRNRRAANLPPLPRDIDVLRTELARRELIQSPELKERSDEAVGYWMVTQWGSNGPTGPIARVVLTMADVALEFAARDPSLFGVSARGEGLVKALAQNLAELVPDDGDLGPRNQFGVRLAEIFLRAGLKTVSDNPEMLISDKHVLLLVENTLPILVKELPPDLGSLRWRGIVETLLGPVASAALQTLGEHPEAFFGDKFKDDKLLGVVTSTFLTTVAKTGLTESVSEAGVVALYKSALGLIAARPELFVGGAATENADEFVTTVLKDFAIVLKTSSPPFDRNVLVKLSATAIDALGDRAAALIDPEKPWQNVLLQTLDPILTVLKQSIESGNAGALKNFVATDGLNDLVGIVLRQAAKTPGMLLKTDNDELTRLIGVVAKAMAEDVEGLLSGDDWLAIAAVAAEEAAANPGRLFGFKSDSAVTDVALPLITGLLKVASAQWKEHGRSGGAVLFGSTLHEAIAVTLRAAASNAAAALANATNIVSLAKALGDLIAANPGRFGYREWLKLYEDLLPQVIASGNFGLLDEPTIRTILSGGKQ